MAENRSAAENFLTIGSRIRVLPIVHGSGDCAIRVREELLSRPYDCLAIPLPPSFQDDVEGAVERLPTITAVAQLDADWQDSELGFSYVPVDPCQGVIAGIRTAIGDRIPRAFIDMETPKFESISASFPDPYSLKQVSPELFAAAILPALPPPPAGQPAARIAWMASKLRELEAKHRLILLVCSLLDWPWIRDAYQRRVEAPEPESFFAPISTFTVDPKTLIFFLGELPFITSLYERGRCELTPDDNLSVDGVKEMVITARQRLIAEDSKIARRITPQLLSVYFRYVRNLCLIERRLTPDLYTLVVAAQQTAGDDFALAIAESARQYACSRATHEDILTQSEIEEIGLLRMGIDQADVPGWGTARMVSRLPGQILNWRTCELRPHPPRRDQKRWKQRWDPHGMCSWPPEDERIESFHRHVREQAKAILGDDLARVEKFTTSVLDGIDIRETLRNWHSGGLYVKSIPPSRGSIEVVVFLFEVPADPQVYVNRATWYAEHSEESTLAFFATDHLKNMVGPGVAQAQYGGAMFLFPPRPIPDVWTDPHLNFVDTLEERLLAAACLHSKDRHVALVSPQIPPSAWRRLARRYGRKLVHIPLKRFGGQVLERIRTFHVLNGKHVRSYAADYIRGA